MRRTRLVALLATLMLGVLLVSWFYAGWNRASAAASILRETPILDAQRVLSDVAMALADRLDRVRSREDARPYYHYQNLFHDPRGLSAGASINPSPLVQDTGDPLIEAHYQVDDTGRLSIPPINEDLKQFSAQARLASNEVILRKLRSAKDELLATKVLVASIATRKTARPKTEGEALQALAVPQTQAPIQQQNFSNQAFVQNMAPNAVFRELEGSKAVQVETGTEDAAEQVEVLTHGFLWKSAMIDGRSELVAMRRVETPVGNLRQGFVVGAEQVRAWLGRQGTQMSITLVREVADAAGLEVRAVPALENWYLEIDTSGAQAIADAKAERLQTAFLWRFTPTAALSIVLLTLLVITVARAERLALERSQFAAAAAHELRTPLAGLQLYGDMLAEGLGDASAKEKYARHISDEAQRLGRVVSNVLGFSQMERNGIRLHEKTGDLSRASREIVERMRPTLEQLGMRVELHIEESVVAVFDEDSVSRILQNLLDNAEKYSRECPERRVHVIVEKNSAVALVRIADSGPGLSRALREQVFKPFRRSTDNDGPAGLGLGLSLSRSLARRQGGELSAMDSSLGGACFALALPLGEELAP